MCRGRRWVGAVALAATAACGAPRTVPAAITLPHADPPRPTTSAPPARSVTEVDFAPVAQAGPVLLLHPAARVERIGFHQANHDGARHLDAMPTAVLPMVLPDRDRSTDPATAVDIVVDPAGEVRAPVSGVVKRGGGYVLYCKYHDDYVVLAPDAQPSWEVKVLHIDGVLVRAGQRVSAGVTPLAPRAARLPFESDIDDFTAEPHWPHVHVEVVDPSIRNKPSPGEGC